MTSTPLKITVAALAVAAGLAIHYRTRLATQTRPTERMESRPEQQPVSPARKPAPRIPTAASQLRGPENDGQPNGVIARLRRCEDSFKLSREQVESYLAENRRSGESLLTAFCLTDDEALLREAAEKCPDDPRVSYVAYFALFKSASYPAERRQWLDALKQSDPENALADYLSAQSYFKAGETSLAVQELLAADGKPKLQDYSADYVQNAEEA